MKTRFLRKALTLFACLGFVMGMVACGGNADSSSETLSSTTEVSSLVPESSEENSSEDVSSEQSSEDSVDCIHTGGTATCLSPAICENCNQPYGEKDASNHTNKGYLYTYESDTAHRKENACCGALVEVVDHRGSEATCLSKSVCDFCGEAYGELAGHSGGKATCTEKAQCKYCDAEYGEANGHSGGEATCTDKAVCEVCETPYGELDADNHASEDTYAESNNDNTHDVYYSCCNALKESNVACMGGEATCTEKAVCEDCETAYGEAKGHSGGTATCMMLAKCETCGEEYGKLDVNNHESQNYRYAPNNDGTHIKKYACCITIVNESEACTGGEATCTEKAQCKYCDAEYGEPNGHSGGEATCTDKAVCEVCETPYGELDADNHASEDTYAESNNDNTHNVFYACCDVLKESNIACTGGEETCTEKAQCQYCDAEYGEPNGHSGGEATCTDKAICEDCETPYGELDADNHASEDTYAESNNDGSCNIKYTCCNAVKETIVNRLKLGANDVPLRNGEAFIEFTAEAGDYKFTYDSSSIVVYVWDVDTETGDSLYNSDYVLTLTEASTVVIKIWSPANAENVTISIAEFVAPVKADLVAGETEVTIPVGKTAEISGYLEEAEYVFTWEATDVTVTLNSNYNVSNEVITSGYSYKFQQNHQVGVEITVTVVNNGDAEVVFAITVAERILVVGDNTVSVDYYSGAIVKFQGEANTAYTVTAEGLEAHSVEEGYYGGYMPSEDIITGFTTDADGIAIIALMANTTAEPDDNYMVTGTVTFTVCTHEGASEVMVSNGDGAEVAIIELV